MKTMNKWMLGVLLTGALASCEMKDELTGSGASQAMGALQLGLSVKEPKDSRASNDVATFPVEIICTDNEENNKTFDSYAEIEKQDNIVPLAVGTYTVTAHTLGTLEGFSTMNEPYYRGEAELVVTEGITEDVHVECTMANTKVSLNLPSDFDKFDTWTITLDDGNKHTLEFSDTDKFDNNTAYWYLGETGVDKLTMNIEATKDGVVYTKSQTLTKKDAAEDYGDSDNPNFTGGDALAINVDVTQEETPEKPDQPQIGFDVSVILTFTDKEESVTIPITPGSGDSDEDDDTDEPSQGGEEEGDKNLPTMTMPSNGHITYTLNGNDQPESADVIINTPAGLKSLIVKIEAGNDGFTTTISDLKPLGLDFVNGYDIVDSQIISVVLNNFLGGEASVTAPSTGDLSYSFPVGAFFSLMNKFGATAPNAHTFKIVLEDKAGNKIEDEMLVTINPEA